MKTTVSAALLAATLTSTSAFAGNDCPVADSAIVIALDDSSSIGWGEVITELEILMAINNKEVLEAIEHGWHKCILLKAIAWADRQYEYQLTNWHKVYDQQSIMAFIDDAVTHHPRGKRTVGGWTQAYFGVQDAAENFAALQTPAERYAVVLVAEGMTTSLRTGAENGTNEDPTSFDITHLYTQTGQEVMDSAIQVNVLVFGDHAQEVEQSYQSWLGQFGGIVRTMRTDTDTVEFMIAIMGYML